MNDTATRTIVDVRADLNDYADRLDREGFAPWIAALIHFVADIIGRGDRHWAERLERS